MNRAVGEKQIKGFNLTIKTLQSGSVIDKVDSYNFIIDDERSYATFYLNDDSKKLKIGQYYKVQLAYIDLDGNVGYLSTAGIIKYTTKPNVYINNFDVKNINNHSYKYIGYYDQSLAGNDTSETVYSYQFNVYNNEHILLTTSGEQLHNTNNDELSISTDEFYWQEDLPHGQIYYIEYIITTNNKMIISSPRYRVSQQETIYPEITAGLKTVLNFSNGYIDISLIPSTKDIATRALNKMKQCGAEWLDSLDDIVKMGFTRQQAEILNANKNAISFLIGNTIKHKGTGAFVVSRADEDHDFRNWEEIYKFSLNNEIPQKFLYRDFTIEQGKTYKYSIQQYNDVGLYSNRIISDSITADFEDMFLFDGEKQLKVRYNPKVSKLNSTILESKQDVIGNQYPYFFRNGKVNYKEFAIAGLISYFMDEEYLFMPKEKLNIPEKLYRGQTKDDQTKQFNNDISDKFYRERIFKTEVLEWLNNGRPKLFKTPAEGNFIVRLMKVSLTPEDKLGRMLHTFNCTAYEAAECNINNFKKYSFINILEPSTEILQWNLINFDLEHPNTGIDINEIGLRFYSLKCEQMQPGDKVILHFINGAEETIIIGRTGYYYIENLDDVNAIEFESVTGSATYSYYVKQKNQFSTIENVFYSLPLFRQYNTAQTNIINQIESDNENIVNWYYIKASRHPENLQRPISVKLAHNSSYDGDYYICLNNEKFMISETKSLMLNNLNNLYIKTFEISSGVDVEICYQVRTIDYKTDGRI